MVRNKGHLGLFNLAHNNITGSPDEAWNRICREGQVTEDSWVDDLISRGVKASHPDDGWVARHNDPPYVQFAYPQFKSNELSIGDLIALGRPDGYKICRVIKIENPKFSFSRGMEKYYFEEVKPKKKRWWQRFR